jgi:hypothetical protein
MCGWIYITFHLCIHQMMDIWVVSTFCLLWIMLLQLCPSFIYIYICIYIYVYIYIYICIYVEFLGHVVILYSTFSGTVRWLSKVAALLFKIFLLIYGSYTGSFLITLPYVHTLYTGLVYSLHYSPSSHTPFLKNVQCSMFHVHTYIKSTSNIFTFLYPFIIS